jgi:Zn-dependent protease
MAGQAAKLGFDWLVQLVALLSVGIGILNLLPIPPLDGGHLAFYALEAVMRRPVSESASWKRSIAYRHVPGARLHGRSSSGTTFLAAERSTNSGHMAPCC